MHFHEPVGRTFGTQTQLQNTWNVIGSAFSVSQSINRVRPTRFLHLLGILVVTTRLDPPLTFYGNDAIQNNFATKFVELMCKKGFHQTGLFNAEKFTTAVFTLAHFSLQGPDWSFRILTG